MKRPDTASLWLAYGKELRHFIQKRVGDPELADDLLQDVFLRIHAHLDTLSHEERVGKWVFQIARNRIADYFKTRKNDFPLPETGPIADGTVLEETIVDGSVEPILRRGILAVISFLPDFDRQLIRLSVCGDIPQIELARRFNMPYSSVKSRVQRAKKKMKDLMTCYCHVEQDVCGRVTDMVPKTENECWRRYKNL